MAQRIAISLTVLSRVGLTAGLLTAAVAVASIGCGGASGGTRGTGGASGLGGQNGDNPGGRNGNGSGGSNGAAGSTGMGGSCARLPAVTGALDCANGVNPSVALITDFSPASWANTMGYWHSATCDLTGSVFSGAKPPDVDAGAAISSITNGVTAALANPAFELKGTVQSGEYGYGGMQFDKCVNTTTYTGIQFTLGGTTAGCDLFVYAQTFDQQGTLNHGGCTNGCYNFPKKQITVGTAPVVVHFADLTPGTADAIKVQIVGLQWQFQSPAGADGGAQPACTNIDLTIDDVKFVTD